MRPKLVTRRTEVGSSWRTGRSEALTDEDGRFELADVPRPPVMLELRGEGILPADCELEGERVDDLEIEVTQRCHFRVDLGAGVPDGVVAALEDAAGERLTIFRFKAGGWSDFSHLELKEDAANVLAAGEDARTLVLSAGSGTEREERRIPLALHPERVSDVWIEW